jgi:putative addiction module component (TIGR02574 family)
MTTALKIHKEAMTLPAVERATLAHDLILSLDDSSIKTVSQEEIVRRVDLVHSGKAQGKSAEEVFNNIRIKL